MFVRIKTVKTDNEVYQYAQIVESFRNAEGKPRQRVIASLGRRSALEVENLKIALQAAADGESVARLLEAGGTPLLGEARDYLPIAVVLAVAKRLGIAAILRELLDDTDKKVATSSVVLALIAHRLIAPGTKLAGVRWFARTAVGHLLDVDGTQLDNSRVHRTLNALDDKRALLQSRVAELFRESTVGQRALFMDVSDTWFEGAGPELAQRHKTKEGLYKKKIGIVLTVNERGQPLRWQVVEGRRHDSGPMKAMAAQLQQISWMRGLPIVFDRAMGKPKHLQDLIDADVRFVTMLTRESIAAYAGEDLELPLLKVSASSEEDEQAQAAGIHVVKEAGFSAVGRRLWVKSLGMRRHQQRSAGGVSPVARGFIRRAARAADAIRLAEELTERKERTGARYDDVAISMGLSPGKASHLRTLMKLAPTLRDVVRQGRCSASLDQLEKIAALDAREQAAAFAAHEISAERPSDQGYDAGQTGRGPSLRVFLVFDPVAFAGARAKALERDGEIQRCAKDLAIQLALGVTSVPAAQKKLSRLLTKYSVNDCYVVHTTSDTVRVERDEATWSRKRRTDGMRLFALHPELDMKASDVIDLYSAKNAIEIDFGIIKSVLQIRPVHHQTDLKVRAHVDICVLALAVERALRDALPAEMSPSMALEELETVRLVDVAHDANTRPIPTLTGATAAQRKLLEHLGMTELLTR